VRTDRRPDLGNQTLGHCRDSGAQLLDKAGGALSGAEVMHSKGARGRPSRLHYQFDKPSPRARTGADLFQRDNAARIDVQQRFDGQGGAEQSSRLANPAAPA
jgi:hypothetical protein